MYYRDPTSEDKGLLDGVVDLSAVSSIGEVQVARNYGFQMMVSSAAAFDPLFAPPHCE